MSLCDAVTHVWLLLLLLQPAAAAASSWRCCSSCLLLLLLLHPSGPIDSDACAARGSYERMMHGHGGTGRTARCVRYCCGSRFGACPDAEFISKGRLPALADEFNTAIVLLLAVPVAIPNRSGKLATPPNSCGYAS